MRIIIYLFILCVVPCFGVAQHRTPLLSYTKDTIANSTIGWTHLMIVSDSSDSISQYCGYLEDRGSRNKVSEWYERANDTLRLFIEQCAYLDWSCSSFYDIHFVVTMNDKLHPEQKWVDFREWLKKVLYYNLDTNYYCADVQCMVSTFGYFEGRGHDVLGFASVIKYIHESKKCSSIPIFGEDYEKIYRNAITDAYGYWRDTVTDSITTPFDTTLPTLEDLDLTILRGPNQGAVSPVANERRLVELIATRNPFTDILELKYRLDKSAMVRIDVYDLLGRAVYSEGQGYKAEGEHVLSLQSKGWSSGSYYVRLSSPSGEVKTVKVVKE